jgi:hypothetical protein
MRHAHVVFHRPALLILSLFLGLLLSCGSAPAQTTPKPLTGSFA